MEDTKLRKCGPNDCCKKFEGELFNLLDSLLGPICIFSSCLRTILKSSKVEKPADPAGTQQPKPKAKAKATAAKTKPKKREAPADEAGEGPPAKIRRRRAKKSNE